MEQHHHTSNLTKENLQLQNYIVLLSNVLYKKNDLDLPYFSASNFNHLNKIILSKLILFTIIPP